MQIVVPMAGIGKRFLDAGYSEPKPLIKVRGKHMIEYIADFFPGEETFIFICNNEHLEKTNLRKVLEGLGVKSEIFGINYEKLGPVWGTLEVAGHIDESAPTVVTYCDFDMDFDYRDFQKNVVEQNADGAIISYTGFHPHLYGPNVYAGVKVGGGNKVSEIKEKHSYTKDKMKSWHSNGAYYFGSGATMLKYFLELVDQKQAHDNGEYYVSQVYNGMIRNGLKVLAYPIDYFCQWGTPEDLEQFEAWNALIKVSPESFKEYDLKGLREKFPHIPKSGHMKAIEYFKAFNQKKL